MYAMVCFRFCGVIKDFRSSCRARPINPKLYQAVKDEFQRLRGYFYVPSDSKVVSPLVIAPKATPPYVRFCGDYVKVNTMIDCPYLHNYKYYE